MTPALNLAARIRAALEKSGVSDADLARECKVSKQAVTGWKKTGRVHKKHLSTIARITHVPVEYFLDADVPLEVSLNHEAHGASEAERPVYATAAHGLRGDVYELAKFINAWPVEAVSMLRVFLMTFGPRAADDRVARHFPPAPDTYNRRP